MKQNTRRKTAGRSSGEVGATAIPSHTQGPPADVAVLLHCSSTAVRFDPSSRSVTGQLRAGLVDAIEQNEKPCVLWTEHLLTFVSSDRMAGGWRKTHRSHDGGEISANGCLVSCLSFSGRSIMSSDSEDDPEYVPTGPQNDGLYVYLWSFNS